MLQTLLVSVAAFTLLYVYLVRKRAALAQLREELDGLQELVEQSH